jgi:sphingolipid delta-4 desaturase
MTLLLLQLKKRFPEFYDTLISHSSYLKVLFKFIFDSNFTLQSRVVRPQAMSQLK